MKLLISFIFVFLVYKLISAILIFYDGLYDREMRFIGADGSLGFKHGKIYKVSIEDDGKYVWIYTKDNRCPYSSMKKLRDNWEDVTTN